ncbi:MAG: hypothetical protein AB7P69_09430, partial [Candidatus Binatia bacterium]
MKFRSSKWAYAAFGLILAAGFLPDIASGQTGTATQVAGLPDGPGEDGDGQVNISGTILLPAACLPAGALNLATCVLTNNLAPAIEILSNPPGVAELVKDAVGGLCVGVPSFLQPGVALPARRGSKANDAIFESDQRQRPTLRVQVKNRGRGVLEFASGLKISRACINDTVPPQPAPVVPIRTSFALVCPCGPQPPPPAPPVTTVIPYAASPNWRTTGP